MGSNNNKLFILSIIIIFIATAVSLRTHYIIAKTYIPGFAVVDKKVIEKQVKSGNLRLHEAKFYRRVP